MKISNVHIYGLDESIVASGYPMQTWVSDVMQKPTQKDCDRAKSLGSSSGGSGHDCFLKGIIVQFDVDFTVKVWTQAERYHWFDFVSSTSTMHRLTSFDLSRAYVSHVDSRIIEVMQELQKTYSEKPTQENFQRLIYSNPCGMRLTARITTNYMQLKTIHAQRQFHRLPEWRQFCDWIESLKMTKELGVCK